MTDLEKFLALYKEFGVELDVPTVCTEIELDECRERPRPGDLIVSLEQGADEKLDGYGGFYSLVVFDKDGKFVKQGFWE